MKKVAFITLLFTMLTVSAKAQWFDFSKNMERAVFGINVGPLGYKSFGDLFNNTNTMPFNTRPWDGTNIGIGVNVAVAGLYLDFNFVTPDHRFDSHVVQSDWDDHNAMAINVGYQIPVYGNYVFITPMIGFSRVTSGYTEGNNIGVDPDTYSIYHEYTPTWHRNDFNYGCGITVVPCKWFEIGATCTAHAAYANVSFNIMNYKDLY